jgi:hypothetical protein
MGSFVDIEEFQSFWQAFKISLPITILQLIHETSLTPAINMPDLNEFGFNLTTWFPIATKTAANLRISSSAMRCAILASMGREFAQFS